MNHPCCVHGGIPDGWYWYKNVLIDPSRYEIRIVSQSEVNLLSIYQVLEMHAEPGKDYTYIVLIEKE